MPKFKQVSYNQLSRRLQTVLEATLKDGLTVNGVGDFKVGETMVTNSEAGLVFGMLNIQVESDEILEGPDGREIMLAAAQRVARKLGVDRE